MGLWKSTDLGVVGHDESWVLVSIKGWTRRTGLLRGSKEQGSSWGFTLEGGSEISVFCGVKMSKSISKRPWPGGAPFSQSRLRQSTSSPHPLLNALG